LLSLGAVIEMTKDRTYVNHQVQAIAVPREEHLEKGPHESALVTKLTEYIEQLDIAEKRRAKAEKEAEDALNMMVGYETDIKELKGKIAYIEDRKAALEKTLENNDAAATERIIEDLQRVQKELARIKALEGNEKQQLARLVLQNEKYRNEIGELKEANKRDGDAIVRATEDRCKKENYRLLAEIHADLIVKLMGEWSVFGVDAKAIRDYIRSIHAIILQYVPDKEEYAEISHSRLKKAANKRHKKKGTTLQFDVRDPETLLNGG
jgi:hypothetical protein